MFLLSVLTRWSEVQIYSDYRGPSVMITVQKVSGELLLKSFVRFSRRWKFRWWSYRLWHCVDSSWLAPMIRRNIPPPSSWLQITIDISSIFLIYQHHIAFTGNFITVVRSTRIRIQLIFSTQGLFIFCVLVSNQIRDLHTLPRRLRRLSKRLWHVEGVTGNCITSHYIYPFKISNFIGRIAIVRGEKASLNEVQIW